MKKVLSSLVAAALSITVISPASATVAVTGLKKMTVATITGASTRSPQVIDLGKGRTLVSWVEENNSSLLALKTKVVSSTNKVGKVIAINTKLAHSNTHLGSLPKLVSNGKGKLFASWVQRSTKGSTVSDQIYGRTSTNGSTWSKTFPISKPVLVDKGFCIDSDMDGCGINSLQISIDGAGRTGVLISTILEEGIFDYKASVTSKTSMWPAMKQLGTVINQRRNEIVGLTTGFAVSWTDYIGGESCSTQAAYFDPKSRKWGTTLTAQAINKNTVVYSKWVQRDSKTLTLVMSSQIEEGGISVRNFSLTTKMFSGSTRVISPTETNVVFQNISAAAKGKVMVIGYTTYNQDSGASQARMILQRSTTGTYSSKIVENSVGQIDPLATGFSKSGTGFFVYNELGKPSNLTMAKGSYTPLDLPGKSSIAYTEDVSISSTDMLSAVSITYVDGKSTITLVKGKLR